MKFYLREGISNKQTPTSFVDEFTCRVEASANNT